MKPTCQLVRRTQARRQAWKYEVRSRPYRWPLPRIGRLASSSFQPNSL
ncbi:hypothetical protein [Baaleninema sp.]